MEQSSWLFRDNRGLSHHVGVYHGNKTGHLLIYVNNSIIKIDFSVKPPKSYSFFINEELVHLHLKATSSGTDYEFEVDTDIDTPINRARKATQRQVNMRFFLALGISIPIFLGLLIFGITYRYRIDNQNALKRELILETGQYAPGVLKFENGFWMAHYEVAEQPMKRSLYSPAWADTALYRGLPLQSGDQVYMRLLPDQPREALVDLDSFPADQIVRFVDRIIPRHQKLHPNLRTDQVRCQIESAYATKGTFGLKILLHQNKADRQVDYKRLVRSIDYRDRVRRDCY